MSASASLKRGWCPGALRPMRTGDGLLVRLRITGGIVPLGLARALAEAASVHGNGLLDLSGRSNLQLRGVSDATLPALTRRLDALGLLDRDPESESVRNVLASPLAGLAPDTLLDIRPIVAQLERRLADDPRLHGLPSKFGFLLDDGGGLTLRGERADIRFDAVAGPDGPTLRIGLGGTALTAVPAGACRPEEVPDVAARLAAVVLADPNPERLVRHPDGPHAEVAAGGGPRSTHDGGASSEAPLRGAPQDEDRGGSQVGHLVFRDLHVASLGIPFGRLRAPDLAALALAADIAGASELRLTPWRTILVPGVEPERVPALLASCEAHAITRSDDPRLAVETCAGAPGCERATTPTHQDAAHLATAARKLAPRGVTLHLSGCRKGCAHPQAASVTLVGNGGRYDLVPAGTASGAPHLVGLTVAGAAAALDRMASR